MRRWTSDSWAIPFGLVAASWAAYPHRTCQPPQWPIHALGRRVLTLKNAPYTVSQRSWTRSRELTLRKKTARVCNSGFRRPAGPALRSRTGCQDAGKWQRPRGTRRPPPQSGVLAIPNERGSTRSTAWAARPSSSAPSPCPCSLRPTRPGPPTRRAPPSWQARRSRRGPHRPPRIHCSNRCRSPGR